MKIAIKLKKTATDVDLTIGQSEKFRFTRKHCIIIDVFESAGNGKFKGRALNLTSGVINQFNERGYFVLRYDDLDRLSQHQKLEVRFSE